MNLRSFLFPAIAVAIGLVYYSGDLLPPDDPSPLPVSMPPDQKMLTTPKTFAIDDYQLTGVASYAVTARVLGHERYFLDRWSGLSPIDLALGWGLMSSKMALSRVSVSQGLRYYQWTVEDENVLPFEDIISGSANTHIIPATKEVEKTVKSLDRGQFVSLTGYLVNVSGPNGSWWNTSLSRDDEGDGACELFYVETARAF